MAQLEDSGMHAEGEPDADQGAVSANAVMSSVAARFFSAAGGRRGGDGGGRRGCRSAVDHDERYNETTHLQYQIPGQARPVVNLNWRYDSGPGGGVSALL